METIPHFATTAIGSFPHVEIDPLCEKIVRTLDIPAWPQLPRISFRENMYIQFSPSLPRIMEDEQAEKITFDTREGNTESGTLFSDELEHFYTRILDDDIAAFALQPEYARGFYRMLEILQDHPGEWVKGQVTGPMSFGLTVTDQDLRASLYDEMLVDAIVKNIASIARWQVRQLKTVRPNIIIFVDEPYMASFGSAFINLERDQVVSMLDEVFAAIHAEGALAGVHCCANTDWSVLLATEVDILNLDAFGYLENLALYSQGLRDFLDRKGLIAWGIVPNNEAIQQTNARELSRSLLKGFETIRSQSTSRGVDIQIEELSGRSIITTSCGLGPTTIEIADRSLEMLVKVGEILKTGNA